MAVGQAFEIVRAINRFLDAVGDKPTPFAGWVALQFMRVQHVVGEVLGVFGSDPREYDARARRRTSGAIGDEEITKLIAARTAARASRDFAASDDIRKRLSDLGVEIRDNPDGTTTWRFR
jgi:cysteinyl-tRNA synthetase